MGDEDVVADDPGFAGAVADGAFGSVAGAAGGEDAGAVAQDGAAELEGLGVAS